MEQGPKKEETIEMLAQNAVHHVLAHSYSFYLFLFLVAVLLDSVFPIKVFQNTYLMPVGLFVLVFASFLILWAQKTSRNLQINNLTKETFFKGPYRYTRSPTHWGLFFLIFGFGLIANAFYIIIFSIVSLIITKLFFLKEEEDLLAKKYGSPYIEYRKSVKF